MERPRLRRLCLRLDEVPWRNFLFVVVGLIVVPLQMTLIPVLRLYTRLDLNGAFLGIWLAHTGFGLPMAIYPLYNFIAQLPRDLIEAAAIDGASHRQIVVSLSLQRYFLRGMLAGNVKE